VEIAAEVMQCAQGYSGCIGVSPNGNHDSSRGVAGFGGPGKLGHATIVKDKDFRTIDGRIPAFKSKSRRAGLDHLTALPLWAGRFGEIVRWFMIALRYEPDNETRLLSLIGALQVNSGTAPA
jgi:hypothetical protein